MFRKNSIASKVSKLNEVDNYPGIFGSGENLAKHFIEQVKKNEIPIVNSSVQTIQKMMIYLLFKQMKVFIMQKA